MSLSSRDNVRDFYDDAADGYNDMMDKEIKLPLYDEVLSRLANQIAPIDGAVLDTSCGAGHMLEKLRNEYSPRRQLIGWDLSPKMVGIAKQRLGDSASISQGDMRDLAGISDGSCAAVINFFSLQHIGPAELPDCFAEWHRVLVPNGQLLIAAWEGAGAIDYGEQSAILTRRYRASELIEPIAAVGLHVESQETRPVDGFEMDAVHITATKSALSGDREATPHR